MSFLTEQVSPLKLSYVSTWKVFHAFYSRKKSNNHTSVLFTHLLLVSSTCKYQNIFSSMLFSQKNKKFAFWLIFPSSRGRKICHCLFLSRIIQTKYFNEEINCHFLEDFGCCLLFMRCHSWLHAYRILIWSYFSSCIFLIFFLRCFIGILSPFKRFGKVLLKPKKCQRFGEQCCNLSYSSQHYFCNLLVRNSELKWMVFVRPVWIFSLITWVLMKKEV